MNKAIVVILAAVVLLAAGFFLFFYEADMGVPNFTGKIYDIDNGRILVAEGVKNYEYTGNIEDLEGEAVWITVDGKTEIIGLDGKEKLNFEVLRIGDSVEIWTVGPFLETYPAQGTASRIGLTDDFEEKEIQAQCFSAGCSGELCTDDPMAASTCELLPGMECLGEGMSCQLIDEECTWVLSESSAQCFLDVLEEAGEEVMNTRIGYLFEKAEAFFEEEM
jgi:hypothetical protein